MAGFGQKTRGSPTGGSRPPTGVRTPDGVVSAMASRSSFFTREITPPPKKNKKNSLLVEKCRTPNIRLCVSGEGVTTPAPTPTPLPWASWGTTSVVPENGGGLRVMDGDVNGVVVNNLADT